MLTAPDGVRLAQQLRWDAASTLGALHPRMLARPSRRPDALGVERVYQYHVRKSAGTSLVYAFFALAGEAPRDVENRLPRFHFARSGPYVFVEHDKRLIGRGNYFFGSSHLPAWDVEVPSNTFTVTVLRDPARRLLSLYNYLRDPASDDGYAFPAPPSQRRMAADGFDAFLDGMPRFHLLNQVHMFSRSGDVGEAAEFISGLSFVLRTERFSQDLRTLSARLDLPLEARSERGGSPKKTLTDAQTERLRETLDPEYRMLEMLDA